MTAPDGSGQAAAPHPDLALDADEARAARSANLRRLHTQNLPSLRALGISLLVLGVAVHNTFVLDGLDWDRWLIYAAVMESYVLVSWWTLRRWYRPDAAVDLSLWFLVLDTVPLAVSVYMSGATRSWIFWVFLFRVVDQTSTYFRRAVFFTVMSVVGYLAVVLWSAGVDGAPVDWPAEVAKLSFLALGGLYMSLTARTVERVRGRLAKAIRVARRSVAELREKSGQLERAREQAEAASQAKSEFLSRVSHELRTPMNAILGFAQLLEMESLTDDQRAHVAEILDGGRHLLDIINEVMDIARVETGTLARELEPVAVRAALDEVLERAKPAAEARAITMPDRAPESADLWVLANGRKLRQVFANLVSNAIKYNSSPGRIEIECQSLDGRARISVSDTGPGIAAENVEAAFAPFDRLGAEKSGVGGTGLGLSVARSLLAAMNGSIGVEPRPGGGSTFWMELQLTDPPAPPEDAGWEEGMRERSGGPLVLYIDDKPDNLTLVRRILARRPGVELASSPLGLKGLEEARSRLPDLVLLDLELPDISGREVLARLREDPDTRNIPVIVVSAEASPAKVERLLADGARAYFAMPYDVAHFLDVIDEVLGT